MRGHEGQCWRWWTGEGGPGRGVGGKYIERCVSADLHDGQQGVKAVQVGAGGLDRHADDWQWRECCHHARQVCRPARARDDGLGGGPHRIDTLPCDPQHILICGAVDNLLRQDGWWPKECPQGCAWSVVPSVPAGRWWLVRAFWRCKWQTSGPGLVPLGVGNRGGSLLNDSSTTAGAHRMHHCQLSGLA